MGSPSIIPHTEEEMLPPPSSLHATAAQNMGFTETVLNSWNGQAFPWVSAKQVREVFPFSFMEKGFISINKIY